MHKQTIGKWSAKRAARADDVVERSTAICFMLEPRFNMRRVLSQHTQAYGVPHDSIDEPPFLADPTEIVRQWFYPPKY